ncbi:extensin-like domain-containing protein [Sphingomicrobium marinum]|uniref:extensin-like domain-containing protein n=1 Tax=Sphingomicrobium marinum TaxID=1227950 RepID=UPI00224016E3|nr:extensin family protein [Sphingomicrobium marinum]
MAGAAFLGWREYQRLLREEPQLFPWTPLDLADPIGSFTDDKLAALTTDAPRCRALLEAAETGDAPAPAIASDTPQCGYDDGMRLGAANGDRLDYGDTITACPVAAALTLWEREIVQPAAARHLGTSVVRIRTLGSYSCRRLYGRADGAWSAHATADAIDISGFELADGRTLTLTDSWNGTPEEAAFLREVRDGACTLFRTTLSPDYNAAHADHFHFDMASGRTAGWSICR